MLNTTRLLSLLVASSFLLTACGDTAAASECCSVATKLMSQMDACCLDSLGKDAEDMSECCVKGMAADATDRSECCTKALDLLDQMSACCRDTLEGTKVADCCADMNA